MNHQYIGHFLLRSAIAFAFGYAAVAGFFDPVSWASYFPDAVELLPVSKLALLQVFGIVELIIAVWLLSGVRIVIPSAIASVLLLGIVFTNFSLLDILFRDLALAGAAAALAFLEFEKTGRIF
ncbi:MAG: hypothetical protein WD175_02385 [Candidatus Paceibacterota bacterium]